MTGERRPTILFMLGAEGRRVVRKYEHDAKEAMEGAHIPIRAPPPDARLRNKGICDQWPSLCNNAEEFKHT